MANNQGNQGSRNDQSNRSQNQGSNASRQATPERDEEGRFTSDINNQSGQGRSGQRSSQ